MIDWGALTSTRHNMLRGDRIVYYRMMGEQLREVNEWQELRNKIADYELGGGLAGAISLAQEAELLAKRQSHLDPARLRSSYRRALRETRLVWDRADR